MMKAFNIKCALLGFLIFNLQFLIRSEAIAQQLPLYSSYVYNPYLLSPSYAGSMDGDNQTARLMLGHRYQYSGFEGAPSTSLVTIDAPMSNKMGIGGSLYTDKMGLIRQTGLELGYAYRIDFNGKAKWHLGLSLNAGQQTLDMDAAIAQDMNENILNLGSANKIFVNGTFGTHIDIKKFTLGFAVQQLTRNQLVYQNYVSNTSFDYGMAPHMMVHTAYRYRSSNNKYGLTPMVVARYIQDQTLQYDAILKADYKDKVYITAGYRGGYAASFGVGAKLNQNLILSYTYDHMINDAGPFTGGGNEFTLGYRFFKGSKAPVFEQPARTDVAPGLTQEEVDRLFEEKIASMRDKMNIVLQENEDQRDQIARLNKKIDSLHMTRDEMTVAAEKVVVKDGFVANNLQFATSSAKLTQSSQQELDRIAAYLILNEEVQLNISGHTDNTGNAQANLLLSQKRAQSVNDYLAARGVASTRMTHNGYGDSKPAASNATEQGRIQNRRVELKIN